MTPSDRTLRDLATDIGHLTRMAAEAVALGELAIAERLVDRVRADVAEMERRVRATKEDAHR